MHAPVGRFAALSLFSSLLLTCFVPVRGQSLAAPPVVPSPLPPPEYSEPPKTTLPPPQLLQDGQARSSALTGDSIQLNGVQLQAPWRLEGGSSAGQRLFVPIDILVDQLGAEIKSRAGGLQFVWFGHVVPLAEARPPLADEPAVDILPLVQRFRWRFRPVDSQLTLRIPPPRLINVRLEQSAERVQIVLDFLGPAPFRRQDGVLLVETRSRDVHLQEMGALGIPHQWTSGRLSLNTATLGPGSHITSFGSPERLVLDLPYEDFLSFRILGPTKQGILPTTKKDALPPLKEVPRAAVKQFQLSTKVLSLGQRRFRLHSVALDLTNPAITMVPLTKVDGMDLINPLDALAKAWQVDLAINGGYFNRVRKLPLGAIKRQGHWLSGPILGRGAIGWGSGERPVFSRLLMKETLKGPRGSIPLNHLNSGYAQKGVARYTHHWGSHYLPLTQGETGVLIQGNRVVRHFAAFQLKGGVALPPGSWLLVARSGASLPLRLGDSVVLSQHLNPSVFAQQPQILGAGPLLLLGGRSVLNAGLENFSAQFQKQKAPRSVVAWGQGQLWLLTIQGLENSGPSLTETVQLVQQLGMEDALNLDGGSSTTLVFQGVTAVNGRGVASRIHNGLGVVLKQSPSKSGSQSNN